MKRIYLNIIPVLAAAFLLAGCLADTSQNGSCPGLLEVIFNGDDVSVQDSEWDCIGSQGATRCGTRCAGIQRIRAAREVRDR